MTVDLFKICAFSNKKKILKTTQHFFNNALFFQAKEYSVFCDGNPVKFILAFLDQATVNVIPGTEGKSCDMLENRASSRQKKGKLKSVSWLSAQPYLKMKLNFKVIIAP